ncbi:Acyltransferase PapA3, partial [Frankliniella fusca]
FVHSCQQKTLYGLFCVHFGRNFADRLSIFLCVTKLMDKFYLRPAVYNLLNIMDKFVDNRQQICHQPGNAQIYVQLVHKKVHRHFREWYTLNRKGQFFVPRIRYKVFASFSRQNSQVIDKYLCLEEGEG